MNYGQFHSISTIVAIGDGFQKMKDARGVHRNGFEVESRRVSTNLQGSGISSNDDENFDADCDDDFVLDDISTIEDQKTEVRHMKTDIEQGKIVLQPHFQREYKWSQAQASLYIESVLLNFPCIPPVVLLKAQDMHGKPNRLVFDGQQRLTSLFNFISGRRGISWSRKKEKKFTLIKLPRLKHLEGMVFKDLSEDDQQRILEYKVECRTIPMSWPFDYSMDFFRRIQGGGTPMTDQEVRRVYAPGKFTDLLVESAKSPILQSTLGDCNLTFDKKQTLLLLYFQYICDPSGFGKPTINDQALITLKALNLSIAADTPSNFDANKEMRKLEKALAIIRQVFDENEAFRRPTALVKKGHTVDIKNITLWVNQKQIHKYLWICTVSAFTDPTILPKHNEILQKKDVIRSALIDCMQRDTLFTESLLKSAVAERVRAFVEVIHDALDDSSSSSLLQKRINLSTQKRRELVNAALRIGEPCRLCGNSLGHHHTHDLLHVDHIVPIAQGGTNDHSNLQVVHKICNLRKSDKLLGPKVED